MGCAAVVRTAGPATSTMRLPLGDQAGRLTSSFASRTHDASFGFASRTRHRSCSAVRLAPRTKAMTLPFGENAGRRSSKPDAVSGCAVAGLPAVATQIRP